MAKLGIEPRISCSLVVYAIMIFGIQDRKIYRQHILNLDIVFSDQNVRNNKTVQVKEMCCYGVHFPSNSDQRSPKREFCFVVKNFSLTSGQSDRFLDFNQYLLGEVKFVML